MYTMRDTIAPVKVHSDLCFAKTRSATGRLPIPELLWAAVDLARRHGIFPTAKARHLEHGKLKQQAEVAGPAVKRSVVKAPTAVPRRPRATASLALIELIAARLGYFPGAVVELEGPRGRMRVETKRVATAKLVALSGALWDERGLSRSPRRCASWSRSKQWTVAKVLTRWPGRVRSGSKKILFQAACLCSEAGERRRFTSSSMMARGFGWRRSGYRMGVFAGGRKCGARARWCGISRRTNCKCCWQRATRLRPRPRRHGGR